MLPLAGRQQGYGGDIIVAPTIPPVRAKIIVEVPGRFERDRALAAIGFVPRVLAAWKIRGPEPKGNGLAVRGLQGGIVQDLDILAGSPQEIQRPAPARARGPRGRVVERAVVGVDGSILGGRARALVEQPQARRIVFGDDHDALVPIAARPAHAQLVRSHGGEQ